MGFRARNPRSKPSIEAFPGRVSGARPLFPGSSESDQLYKICSVLGTPTTVSWPEGFKLAAQIGYRFPQFVPTRLETLVPQANADGIQLMQVRVEQGVEGLFVTKDFKI